MEKKPIIVLDFSKKKMYRTSGGQKMSQGWLAGELTCQEGKEILTNSYLETIPVHYWFQINLLGKDFFYYYAVSCRHICL